MCVLCASLPFFLPYPQILGFRLWFHYEKQTQGDRFHAAVVDVLLEPLTPVPFRNLPKKQEERQDKLLKNLSAPSLIQILV